MRQASRRGRSVRLPFVDTPYRARGPARETESSFGTIVRRVRFVATSAGTAAVFCGVGAWLFTAGNLVATCWIRRFWVFHLTQGARLPTVLRWDVEALVTTVAIVSTMVGRGTGGSAEPADARRDGHGRQRLVIRCASAVRRRYAPGQGCPHRGRGKAIRGDARHSRERHKRRCVGPLVTPLAVRILDANGVERPHGMLRPEVRCGNGAPGEVRLAPRTTCEVRVHASVGSHPGELDGLRIVHDGIRRDGRVIETSVSLARL